MRMPDDFLPFISSHFEVAHKYLLLCHFSISLEMALSCNLDENDETRWPAFVFGTFCRLILQFANFNCLLSRKSQFVVIGLWLRQFYEVLRCFFQCQSCSDPSKALLCPSFSFFIGWKWRVKKERGRWKLTHQRSAELAGEEEKVFSRHHETKFVAICI